MRREAGVEAKEGVRGGDSDVMLVVLGLRSNCFCGIGSGGFSEDSISCEGITSPLKSVSFFIFRIMELFLGRLMTKGRESEKAELSWAKDWMQTTSSLRARGAGAG